MISATLMRQRSAINKADTGIALLRVEVPVKLERLSNGSQGATMGGRIARAKRVKMKRLAVALKLRGLIRTAPLLFEEALLRGGLAVVLTRIAPGTLDDDGLSAACKAVRDGVADALGIDDGDARVVYLYTQEKSKAGVYACRVEIYA